MELTNQNGSPHVVGRSREQQLIAAALATNRNLVLEGPPGTGKSTMLRALVRESGHRMVFVEGNAELTPSRLVGSHDPALVIQEGYTEDAFLPGPLTLAAESGAVLYLEEINRIPEETLNVLITVMSERELMIPRVGARPVHDRFTIVAAMNPFDAIGTARIAGALNDRMCRVFLGYQNADEEAHIVALSTGFDAPDLVEPAVAMVRATRHHPDLTTGSSVRGAIDLAYLAEALAATRGGHPWEREASLDAALMALSGRVTVREGSARTSEEIIEELWGATFGHTGREDRSTGEQGDSGKAIGHQ